MLQQQAVYKWLTLLQTVDTLLCGCSLSLHVTQREHVFSILLKDIEDLFPCYLE